MDLFRISALCLLVASTLPLSACAGGQAGQSHLTAETQEEFAAAIYQAMQDRALNRGLPPNTTAMQFTIGVGLQVLSDVHLTPHDTFDLVAAGFANLARTDPDFDVSIGDRDIEISTGGKRLHWFALPPERAFPEWGLEVDKSIQEYLKQRTGNGGLAPDALYDAFLEGVASASGPFTDYATRDDVRLQESFLAGETADVGLGVEISDAGAEIRAILDVDLLDVPLLKQGNTIVSIDGHAVIGLGWVAVEKLLLGPAGTSAALGIVEPGKDTSATVSVRRVTVNPPPLRRTRVGDMLHVEIVQFHPRTAISLIDAMKQASQKGPEIKGIILDLRSSPQGQLDSGIAVADIFLEEGKILSTWGRHENTRQIFEARGNAATNRLPLVILIREETEGVAIVVASALQDLERAVVIGQASGGSGPITGGIRLPNGGVFNIPVAEVFASSGYHLNRRGVMPTICTSDAASADAVIEALRREQRMIDHTTRTRDVDTEDAAEIAAFRALCPARRGGTDVDLAVAQALLEDGALFAGVLSASNVKGQTASR
jgi:carboxyl-terminal processing protease